MITTEQLNRLKGFAARVERMAKVWQGYARGSEWEADAEALRAAVETLEELPLTADKCRITDDDPVFHPDYIERQKGEYSYLFHDGDDNAVSRYGDFRRGVGECYFHRANAEAALASQKERKHV